MSENVFVIIKADGTRVPTEQIDGLTVEFQGRDAVVEIGEGSRFRNARITMGDGGVVKIGTTHRRGFNNTVMDLSGKCPDKDLSIGAGTSIEGARFAMAGGGPRVVSIGQNCLLSSAITFRPSDGHAIFDLNTGQVINHARPIRVGNHVWVGAGVTFVKGSQVADNTVVGTGSLVSRKFEQQYVAIAGNPATMVRSNIGWDRAHVEDYAATHSIM